MADNIRFQGEGWLRLEMTAGIGLQSGDVAVIGAGLTVDLITDADAVGVATVMFPCSYVTEHPVVGEDDQGNAAVNIGDPVYIDGTDINADAAGGVFYGYALGAVLAGATTTIQIARAA